MVLLSPSGARRASKWHGQHPANGTNNASICPIPNSQSKAHRTLQCSSHMTTQRRSSGDGHATENRAVGDLRHSAESPTGAFDLLAAQIDSLRQEIDYLKEQVALLQEHNSKHRKHD